MPLLALAAATYFMVSGGPYGIEDILGGAGYARALVILLLLPLVWTLPTTLMIGELAATLPVEGGFYVWVQRALGPFWGYQEAWLSLAASVFDMAIYPTLFTLYLGQLAPALVSGHRALASELALVAGCCVWNLLGAREVGRGAAWLLLLLLAPFGALVVCAAARGVVHPAPWASWTVRPAGGSLSTAVLVGLWNYMGWDNSSTVAQEVQDPARTYPRAMALAALLVAASYVVPLAAMAVAGVQLDQFSTGAWAGAGRLLGGPGLQVAIAAGGALSALGMINALTLSYARLPLVLAEQGWLPAALARRNRRGVPWVAVLACGAAWALALGLGYERLISIDLVLYGSSLVLEFVALLVLRVREPGLARPFRMGSFATAAALSAMPVALVGYAVWASRAERMAGMPALLFAVLIAAGGVAAYFASRRWRQGRSRG